MDGHTLVWKGNFAETLLQSSSIYFTIYHFLPSINDLFICSYHWYSRIQFSKPQCTSLFSILSNRTQKGTAWKSFEHEAVIPMPGFPHAAFGDPLLATTGFVGVLHATPLIALDFAYGTHQKNKRYSPILIDSPISGCPIAIGKIKNHQLSKPCNWHVAYIHPLQAPWWRAHPVRSCRGPRSTKLLHTILGPCPASAPPVPSRS